MRQTVGATSHPLVSEAAVHLIEAGGKRLRPALVLITSRAGSAGETSTDLAAAAVELVHLATLYHDDVIDETETRRGVPTVHAKWGVDVAVLAGDYLFARGCALGADAGGEVPGILARAIGRVCEGQIAETASAGDPLRPVERYVEVIRAKTAALFAAACDLGASTSGAGDRVRAGLVEYGENLGLAFQVVDDLLDVVGDPDYTGKEQGSDLREGVFTLPYLIAASRDEALGERLRGGERRLSEVFDDLVATGALESCRRLAESYAGAAGAALVDAPTSEWRTALETIIDGVLAQLDA